MLDEEKFQNIFSQKVAKWENNYINYSFLKQKLETIIERNKNDIQEQIKENKEIKEINPEIEVVKKKSEENLSLEEEILLPPSHNKIQKSEENLQKISFNKITKDFIKLLDKELLNFYEFYKNKENHLKENINLQINNFRQSNKPNGNNQKIEIISELIYLSNLCKELLNYVYLNIMALLRILYKFDSMFTNISYNYIKKYLSKKNGYLVYILGFKIVDESLVSIEEILTSIEDILKKNNFFKNNKNIENKFNENSKTIKENINKSNEIHEKIYLELNEWEKYLHIFLDLPNSGHNSIFKETSFVGDKIYFSENEIKKKKSIKMKYIEIDDYNINGDNNENINDENINLNNEIKTFKDEELIVNFGLLFDPLDTFSFSSNKILSKEDNSNLSLILFLAGFYSYSYILLVPNMIRHLIIFAEKSFYLYGIAISIPILGNIVTNIFYEKYFSKFPFKVNLVVSLFFIILYYVLSFIGIRFSIIITIIGRFFLGLSYLKQLTKIYINNYIPTTNIVRANEKYTFSIYLGYIIGLFINFLFYFKWKKNENENENENEKESNLYCIIIIIGLSLNYNLIMLVSIISQFKVTNKNNTDLNQNIINEINNNNQKSLKLIEEDKKIDNLLEVQEDNDDLNKDNLLSEFVKYNKKKNKNTKYYKIFIILLIVLFTSQYISENLLLLLPRLLTYDGTYNNRTDNGAYNEIYNEAYNDNNNNNKSNLFLIIFPLLSSLSYLISYFLTRYYLKNSYFQKMKKMLLIIISFAMFIISFSFIFLCIDPKKDFNFLIIFPICGFFVLIILNELYHIATVNYFINLLPTQTLTIGFFEASTLINYITKLVRFIPSFIFLFYYLIKKIKYKDVDFNFIIIGQYPYTFSDVGNFNLCNSLIFGIQILFLLINVIILTCFSSYMESGPSNRILNLK